MSNSDDFAQLLAGTADGDQLATNKLIERYEPKVRIVAHVLLGRALRPYVDSVDLVQSVHHSLIIGLRHRKFYLSTPEELIALAITIVRRKVARKWRYAQRQHRLSAQLQRSGLAQVLASVSDSIEDPARQAEFNDQLENLCRHLSSAEQRMLEMRLSGYTAAEVGQELNLHPVAVRVRWSRLRNHLRENGVVTDWL